MLFHLSLEKKYFRNNTDAIFFTKKSLSSVIFESSSGELEEPCLAETPSSEYSLISQCRFMQNAPFTSCTPSFPELCRIFNAIILFYQDKVNSVKNLMGLFFSQSSKGGFLNSLDQLLKDKNHWRQRDYRKAEINTELKKLLKTGSLCCKVLLSKENRQ